MKNFDKTQVTIDLVSGTFLATLSAVALLAMIIDFSLMAFIFCLGFGTISALAFHEAREIMHDSDDYKDRFPHNHDFEN